MVKVIFCDLGNVLVKVNYPRVLQALSSFFNLPETFFTQPTVMELEIAFEAGKLSQQEYLTQVKTLLPNHNHFQLADLVRLWQVPFDYDWEVWEIIQNVRQRTPVFLLSNTNPIHIQAIRQKFDLFQYLDGWVLSYEVGAIKPDPAIYQAALRQALVQPEQALFIDDLPANVSGAQALNIQAYQFSNAVDLKKYLLQLGLIN